MFRPRDWIPAPSSIKTRPRPPLDPGSSSAPIDRPEQLAERAKVARRTGAGRLRWVLARLLTAILLVVALPSAGAAEGVPRSREQIALSFAPVVREAAPAVVNIFTRRQVASSQLDPFFSDPFFQFFFRDFDGPEPVPRAQNSLGSGVIVDADGLIVTNHHVIEDADQIMVVLNDRREFEARVVGADAAADLALLRVDTDTPLPTMPIGDSDQLEVGDLVLAIGNPFGIGQSVTSGIVSALGRTAPQLTSDLSFIQTDAAVNPGNSGGALVTIGGRLVGVNTAIFTRSGGSIGIGFAIPINLVKAMIRSVEGGGKGLARPWLGARGRPVDASLAESLGLDRPTGVLIEQLHPAGPAAKAGLKPGDVILSIDGTEVTDPRAVNFRLAVGRLGHRAALELWRDERRLRASLPLETPPRDPPPQVTELPGRHVLAGATVANLSPGFNEEIGLDLFQQGVVVLGVANFSPAAQLGLRQGDIITTISGRTVDSVDRLLDLMGRVRTPWQLEVQRGERHLAVVIGQ